MLNKRSLGWMVSIGAVLWVVSLLVGLWFKPEYIRDNWRLGSEIVWLGLGVIYTMLWVERVRVLSWKLLVVDVLVYMFGVLVIWILGLLIITSLFNQIDTLGSLKELDGIIGSSVTKVGWLGQIRVVLGESLRLWVVGMTPVAVRKLAMNLWD